MTLGQMAAGVNDYFSERRFPARALGYEVGCSDAFTPLARVE